MGDRAGNFAVQNADVLLVLGCRLHIRQISYNWKAFARHAYKIQVDIDEAELSKPTVRPDLPVHADVRRFLETANEMLAGDRRTAAHGEWLTWNKQRVHRYPVVQEKHRSAGTPLILTTSSNSSSTSLRSAMWWFAVTGRLASFHFKSAEFRTASGSIRCGERIHGV